nr:uncharacterized protein LOC111413650 [Onthophagus taurus]
MAKKWVLFFVFLCIIEISLSTESYEKAKADAKLQAKGFSCFKKEFGPMKDRQVNNNYSPKVCGQVTCNKGVLTYVSCSAKKRKSNKPQDPKKEFPKCCNY